MELNHPPRKILIVDDNAIDRETCRRFLGRFSPAGSYTFIEHDSVKGAVALALEEKPDCILLDYHLHDGTGVEFLEELFTAATSLDFPVVMLTGTGNESIAVEVMKIGAKDYIGKDRLNADILQRTVEAAIYKVQTERLIEAQKREMERLFSEAQVANARKDHFLATLSHELRTPLTPVLAAVDLLEEVADEAEEVREIAAIIRRNIELESQLIDDMLDLTRIANGKMDLKIHPVDVQQVLRGSLETCREEITRQNLRVSQNFQGTGAFVNGDATRLQQVFWNLIKNAAKFTPKGGSIELSTSDSPDGWVEIRVRDTGVGIDPADLESIFLSFEQGTVSRGKRFGGLGLGLAISRSIVDAHGGEISASQNPEGQGAEFTVRLPKAAPESAPAQPNPPKPSRPDQATGLTVLVVEDHADSSFFFSRIIRGLGHKVLTAGSASEAVNVFRENKVDCVISDIGLPDGLGTDLLPRLHEIRKVPAIALSGYGMPEDFQRSSAAGFDRHLIKPIKSDALVTALNEILEPAPAE